MTALEITTKRMWTIEAILGFMRRRVKGNLATFNDGESRYYNDLCAEWDELKVKRDQLKNAA